MRKRPLNPQPVLFTRVPGQQWPSRRSFADIVRRRERVFLNCNCRSGITITADFSKWPWRRYLNYPLTDFVCPTCGERVALHRHDGPGTPGPSGRFNDRGNFGQ